MEIRFHPEKVHPTAFIAPNATVLGDVTLEAEASVWFSAVVRGDRDRIVIGTGSNVQDCCVIHVEHGEPTIIGKGVTLAHGAIVHSATIEDNVLIGVGATIMSRARIGEYSIIGAGAVVTEDMIIPPRSVVVGVPARVIGPVREKHIAEIHYQATEYQKHSQEYKKALSQ